MDWEQIRSIAEQTTGQATNPLWLKMRKQLLTASRFGDILEKDGNFAALEHVAAMLKEDVKDCEPMRWGREKESLALKHYAKLTQNIVVQTGLWMFPKGHIAASPDGMVRLPGDRHFSGVLEIKCPYSLRYMGYKHMMATRRWPKCFLNASLEIDKRHHYYHQIQGQLFATKMKWCDFFIWTPNWNILKRIFPDDEWRQKEIPKLEHFVERHLLIKFKPGAHSILSFNVSGY
jgi:hypothetical protein